MQWIDYPSLTAILVLVAACAYAEPQTQPDVVPIQRTPALNLNAFSDLEAIIPALADKRVVFVGEQHTRYDHHLTQLEIIRRLYAIDPRLAIGMEAFQQPFQDSLDGYLAGRLSEQQMLRDSEYFSRWRLDYRLYAPILRFAREHGLPLVALNLPQELTRKVGREGIEGLSSEERATIPAEIDRSDSDYEKRLKKVFALHPKQDGQRFERFMDVQLLWDEGMAKRAADFLAAHPDYRLVVLAGGGHLAHGSGIPKRLLRRTPVASAIVLNNWLGDIEPGVADILLMPQERELPAAGKLGAVLSVEDELIRVVECGQDSACAAVGIKPNDQLVSLDGQPITSMAEVHLAMWDKKPGDEVTVEIRRKRWFADPKLLTFEVELRESP